MHTPKKKKNAALLIPEEVDFSLSAACPWMSQLCRENTSKLAQCQACASSRSELSLSTRSSDDHGGHNPARVKQLRVSALCSSWTKSTDSIFSYKGIFSFVHPTSGTVCKARRGKQRHLAPAHPPQLVMPPEAWSEGSSRSPLCPHSRTQGVSPTAYTELHSPQVSVHQQMLPQIISENLNKGESWINATCLPIGKPSFWASKSCILSQEYKLLSYK